MTDEQSAGREPLSAIRDDLRARARRERNRLAQQRSRQRDYTGYLAMNREHQRRYRDERSLQVRARDVDAH